MEVLLTLLRAAHCKSSHHLFALDAFPEIQTEKGILLAHLLLAHHSKYLTGAKDPDNVFKDFENHVLHVRDGYWGGAVRTAERWYAKSSELLERELWGEAAYAIGVLSHYFTDPFMPLHTGQTERESVVHRPLEWSVRCAYDEILRLAIEDAQFESFPLASSENWLAEAIQRAATQANSFYDSMLSSYNMSLATKDPARAINRNTKRDLAQIFTWVLTGWAGVLDRLANNSPVSFPSPSLTPATLVATIQVPAQWVLKKIDNAQQRQEVAKIFEEFQTTGKVVRHLAPEQKGVKFARARDPLLQKRLKEKSNEPERALLPAPLPVDQTSSRLDFPKIPQPMPSQDSVVSPPHHEISDQVVPEARLERAASEPNFVTDTNVISSHVREPHFDTSPTEAISEREEGRTPAKEGMVDQEDRVPSFEEGGRLDKDAPIVDAPSIGPKTAARFDAIGCHTVGQFLNADPADLSASLATQWITPDLIRDWQHQARLMCQVERLTAVAAILFVEAHIHSADQLSEFSVDDLQKRCLEASQTRVGMRALRNQPPPNADRLQAWIESARRFKTFHSNRSLERFRS